MPYCWVRALRQATNCQPFSGAEGYGAGTPGGRGGEVILVSNLNDSGPGSLFSRMEADCRQLVELVREPFPTPAISHTTAENAYLDVLAGAGATLPVRDAVDGRIVADVHEGTGAIIDSQWEVDGWPQYQTARPPQDSDRDGMPDIWEHSHGLNPKDATDSRADRDGDGYTSIEEYFHSLEE